MSRRPPLRHPAHQLCITWQAVSLLLGYPDAELPLHLDLVDAAADTLPEPLGGPLRQAVVRLRATPLEELQQEYVETFDHRRRCNLFLTYFAHGDTRKRGVALLRFKQTYLRSGFLLDDSELPDHLCVVLEYAATVDPELGWGLLLDHRAGVELLRIALRERRSTWAPLLEALTATMPPLHGDERDAVRRLAAEGPPAEEVGLTPYGTPQLGPLPADPAQDLPMPTLPTGGRR